MQTKKECTMSYLPILRELTNLLHEGGPNLSDIIKTDSDDIIEYEVMDIGKAVAFGIYNVPDIAVSKVFISEGAKTLEHEHDTIEWLILYEGSVMIDCEGQDWKINKGQGFYILNNSPHTVEALEDAWMIAITIPADRGFPSAAGG